MLLNSLPFFAVFFQTVARKSIPQRHLDDALPAGIEEDMLGDRVHQVRPAKDLLNRPLEEAGHFDRLSAVSDERVEVTGVLALLVRLVAGEDGDAFQGNKGVKVSQREIAHPEKGDLPQGLKVPASEFGSRVGKQV